MPFWCNSGPTTNALNGILQILHRLESRIFKVENCLNSLDQQLHELKQTGYDIMATLQDLLDDVSEETTLVESVATLIKQLKAQLADALSGETLPPAVQAKIDQIFSIHEENTKALADAIVANTTPADEGPVE